MGLLYKTERYTNPCLLSEHDLKYGITKYMIIERQVKKVSDILKPTLICIHATNILREEKLNGYFLLLSLDITTKDYINYFLFLEQLKNESMILKFLFFTNLSHIIVDICVTELLGYLQILNKFAFCEVNNFVWYFYLWS